MADSSDSTAFHWWHSPVFYLPLHSATPPLLKPTSPRSFGPLTKHFRVAGETLMASVLLYIYVYLYIYEVLLLLPTPPRKTSRPRCPLVCIAFRCCFVYNVSLELHLSWQQLLKAWLSLWSQVLHSRNKGGATQWICNFKLTMNIWNT